MNPDDNTDAADHSSESATGRSPDHPVTAVVGRRALQGLIDSAVVVGVAYGLFFAAVRGFDWIREAYPDRLTESQSGQVGLLADLVFGLRVWFPVVLGLWALLFLVLTPWLLRGRTPGMLVMRLRVVTRDGRRPTLLAHLLRAVGLLVEVGVPAFLLGFVIEPPFDLGVALVVPLIAIAVTADHTRLGDVLARTRVVWAPSRG